VVVALVTALVPAYLAFLGALFACAKVARLAFPPEQLDRNLGLGIVLVMICLPIGALAYGASAIGLIFMFRRLSRRPH
jgi:hypothetical protein